MSTQEQLDLSLSEQARLIDKCVKMRARIELLEKVVEAADYLKAEFLIDWQLGRLSVDSKGAATNYEEKRQALAALKEQT